MKLINLTAILLMLMLVVSCKDDEVLNTYEQWIAPNVLVTNDASDVGYSTATVSVSINGFDTKQIGNDVKCFYIIGEIDVRFHDYRDKTVKYYENLLAQNDYNTINYAKGLDVNTLSAQLTRLNPNTEYCFIPFLYHKQEGKYIIGKSTTFKTLGYQPSFKITSATMIDDCHMCIKGQCDGGIPFDKLGEGLSFSYNVSYYSQKINWGFSVRNKYIRGSDSTEIIDTLWVDVFNGEKLYVNVDAGVVREGHYVEIVYENIDSIIIEPSIIPDWKYVEAVQEPQDTRVTFWSTASNLNQLYLMGSEKIQLGYFFADNATLDNFDRYSDFLTPEFDAGQMKCVYDVARRNADIVFCPGFRYRDERTGKWNDCYGQPTYYKTNDFATVAPKPSEAIDLGLSVKWAPCCIGQMAIKETPYAYHFDPDVDEVKDNWGESWRLPTVEEVKELFANCHVSYSYSSGVYEFTSKINGQKLFLHDVNRCLSICGFWTSDTFQNDNSHADVYYYNVSYNYTDRVYCPKFESGPVFSSLMGAIHPVTE